MINFVIQSIIQPKFVADAVNISLTLTFLSLVFWTFVIGPIGAILAVPLTLLMKALLLDVDPSTRWMSGLIDRRPRPARGCGGRRGDHARRAEAGLGRSRLAGSRFGGRQPAGYRPRRRRVDPHS